jgi:hypothetical protein
LRADRHERPQLLLASVRDRRDELERMFYGTHRVYRFERRLELERLERGPDAWSRGDPQLAIAPSNPNMLYAATNDGNVLVSTNGGSSFRSCCQACQAGRGRRGRSRSIPRMRCAYVAVVVRHGADPADDRRGQNWTNLDANLPDVPVNVVAALAVRRADLRERPTTVVVLAGRSLSWSRYGTGLRAAVIDILLEPARHRIVLATQGRGAWEARL